MRSVIRHLEKFRTRSFSKTSFFPSGTHSRSGVYTSVTSEYSSSRKNFISSSSTTSETSIRSSPSASGFTSRLWCITETSISGINSSVQSGHSTSPEKGSEYSSHCTGVSVSSDSYSTKTVSSPLAFTMFSSGFRSSPRISMVYQIRPEMSGRLEAMVYSSLTRRVSFLCTVSPRNRTVFFLTEISVASSATGRRTCSVSSTAP